MRLSKNELRGRATLTGSFSALFVTVASKLPQVFRHFAGLLVSWKNLQKFLIKICDKLSSTYKMKDFRRAGNGRKMWDGEKKRLRLVTFSSWTGQKH